MTNGKKLKETFPDTKIITQYDNPFGDRFMVLTLNNEDMQVNIEWWNAEYKEPTTKNDLGVDDEERTLALMYLEQIKEDYIEGVGYERHPLPEYYAIETAIKSLALPSVTPQEPVIDKIRVEIKQYQSDYDVHGTESDRTAWKAFNRCLQILDKYKTERSVEE